MRWLSVGIERVCVRRNEYWAWGCFVPICPIPIQCIGAKKIRPIGTSWRHSLIHTYIDTCLVMSGQRLWRSCYSVQLASFLTFPYSHSFIHALLSFTNTHTRHPLALKNNPFHQRPVFLWGRIYFKEPHFRWHLDMNEQWREIEKEKEQRAPSPVKMRWVLSKRYMWYETSISPSSVRSKFMEWSFYYLPFLPLYMLLYSLWSTRNNNDYEQGRARITTRFSRRSEYTEDWRSRFHVRGGREGSTNTINKDPCSQIFCGGHSGAPPTFLRTTYECYEY